MQRRVFNGALGSTLCSCLLALCAATEALAQYSAGIEGTVTDQSGTVVAGPKITIANEETNLKQSVSASSQGFFSVYALPPGAYTVAAEFAGFAPAVYTHVQVSSEIVRVFNITLHPKSGKQSVTITAEAAASL